MAEDVNEIVVATDGSGDYRDLGEAVRAAAPGTRILLRPGTYPLRCELRKPIEIVATGGRDETVIFARTGDVITTYADAVIRGVTIRLEAPVPAREAARRSALIVVAGSLRVEECRLVSNSASVLVVRGPHASPTFLRCVIECIDPAGEDELTCGIVVLAGSPRFIDCYITGAQIAGIDLREDATPEFVGCLIEGCKLWGLLAQEARGATFENCTFRSNGAAGVYVSRRSAVLLRNSRIVENHKYGLLVDTNGHLTLMGCSVENNGQDVRIDDRAFVRCLGCRIGKE